MDEQIKWLEVKKRNNIRTQHITKMAITKNRDDENVNFWRNFKTYLKFVGKYKAFYVAIFFIVVILESARTFDKYLFKLVIDNGTAFSAGTLSSSSFLHILIILGGLFLGVVLVKGITNWVQVHLINRLDSSVILDMKTKFFNHLVGLSHSFHTTHKTGSIISRITRGSRAIEKMTDFLLFNALPLIVQIVIVAVVFSYLDITTSIVITLTSIIFIIYSIYLNTIRQKPNLIANRAEDIEKSNIGDVFMNIDSIKYFGKEKYINSKFSSLAETTRRYFVKVWDYGRWFDSGQSAIMGLGTFFLFFFSLKKFLAGELSIGTIAFIYTAFLSIQGPLFGFVHSIRGFYQAMADFQDLFSYSFIENDIKDSENAENLEVKKGEIELKDVSFKYHKRNVIDNVSIKVKPGEKVALVGHSGSGKTTLVKLLYRLYDVNSGEIVIDGKNIKNFKQESLRSELSVVPQECVLFDDTIYNNILFSRPDATRKEVLSAIRFAQLDDFVKNLPKKERTIVGERGVKLSGGEKQRVSIARALLANKKILVLDEATSALDSRTEYEIQKDLLRLMKDRTSIIIAHRLSTIMHADKIVVMDKGRIVQQGKHNELIRKSGTYRELWNLQKGGYLEE